MRTTLHAWLGLVLAAALLSGCVSAPLASQTATAEVTKESPTATMAATETPVLVLTEAQLANMSYLSTIVPEGQVKLENGEAHLPSGAGGVTETVIRLTEHFAFGPLGPYQQSAAAVLVTDPGGSGRFYDLAIVAEKNGAPENIVSVSLGDRVVINSLSIEAGEVRIDMLTQAPTDPMCCPTQHKVEIYRWEAGRLENVPTPAELAGTSWVLEGYVEPGTDVLIPVPEEQTYSLDFLSDGRMNVQTDCSLLSGAYRLEGWQLDIEPGPITMIECSPGSLATQYVAWLEQVNGYQLEPGQLVLDREDAGRLLFRGASPEESAAEIIITMPQAGVILDLTRPVLIAGTGQGLFEGSLVVELHDDLGNLLAQQATTLVGEEVGVGGAGTWSVELVFDTPGIAVGQSGEVLAYATSPKDGSKVAAVRIPVRFK